MINRLKVLSFPVLMSAAVLLNGYTPAVASDSTTLNIPAYSQVVNVAQDSGTPPAPPDGSTPPNGAPPGGSPGDASGATTTNPVLSSTCGAYTLDGGDAVTSADQTYASSTADQSAACLINVANLTLTDVTVTKTGDSSSSDQSSFYGLNAGILVGSGSQLTITGGTVDTDGSGTNGVFSTGEGTVVNLSDMTIDAMGDGAHAVMATLGGTLNLTNVDMNTTDVHSGAIATDRGSGTITAVGGTVTTSGQDSPAIYSTGVITVSDATLSSSAAEVAVIEGANSITLNNTKATSSVADKWGVMLYQSFSGDAEGTEGSFTMNGGSLSDTDANSPLFYVTNATGTITLKGVDVSAKSGVLVKAEANDRWGTSGSNGGTAIVIADAQTLSGNLVADSISGLNLTLENGSSLTGAINAEKTAKIVSVTLDKSSTWTVTADSYVTTFADADGISGTSITNIVGNGHNIYYDASSAANSALNGQTYDLVNGGQLAPAS
jgi:hypothetical protein